MQNHTDMLENLVAILQQTHQNNALCILLTSLHFTYGVRRSPAYKVSLNSEQDLHPE